MEKYLKTPMETVREWMAEGRLHVSPAEAAEVLQCDQEGLTAAYRAGDLGIAAFKSGRNLRIMVSGIMRLLKGGEDPLEK